MILLLTIISIHLLITILFSVLIGKWNSKESTDKPSLSIIIAARNEATNLKLLLPKLMRQEYPKFEVIIGLDRCSDQSLEVVKSVEKPNLKYIDVQQIPDGWNSKKYALSRAIEASDGDWLVFTDADCQPNSNLWLASIVKEIDAKTDIVIGISPYTVNRSVLSKFIQFEAFMIYFLYSGFTLLRRSYMAVGRNLAVRKSYFQELGGYESFKGIKGGDDDLFIQKADKKRISLLMGKKSLVYTYPSESLLAYKKQKLRHLSVGKHYSKLDIFLLSLYHSTHLALYALMIIHHESSFLLPIILFLLFIKLVSYRFVARKIGGGFNYILLPIVDILYAFMIPIIGIWSKLIKDIEWKN